MVIDIVKRKSEYLNQDWSVSMNPRVGMQCIEVVAVWKGRISRTEKVL